MKTTEVLNCMFSSWYPLFKSLTFKSAILELPSDVIGYLLSDGLVLPEGCEENHATKSQKEDDSDEGGWSSEEDANTQKPVSFPIFQAQLVEAISSLGGEVFPKLNWSAPRDAAWVTFDHTLKCTTPRDIFLLLKSSDFITHDLTLPFSECEDCRKEVKVPQYTLVLRRWYTLHPGNEFRCFVYNNTLIGICQRDHTSFFDFLISQKDVILSEVQDFFKSKIKGAFPGESYVFDIYRKSPGKIYIVDFNPFGPVTDSLLYTWEELMEPSGQHEAEMRIVQSSSGICSNPYQCYTVPQDFVHLASGEDPHKLIDFLKMKTQGNAESSTDDEEYESHTQCLGSNE